MDRKSIIVLVVSFGLLLLWPALINKVFPPKPLPGDTNLVGRTTNNVERGTNLPALAARTSAAPVTAEAPAPAKAAPLVAPGTPEQVEVIESAEARYTFTSHGGGLKLVELKGYPESVGRRKDKAATNRLATLNGQATMPVLALLGSEALQGDGLFQLTRMANSVRAEKVLSNGLALVKEFRTSTNFLLAVTTRLENRGVQPLALPDQEWIAGTATPMGPTDDGTKVGVFWSDANNASHVDQGWFANRTLGCIPGTPRSLFAAGQSNVVWTAVHNQFFALAVMPKSVASQVFVVQSNLPPPSVAVLQEAPKANRNPLSFQATLVFPATTLASGQKLEQEFHIYAGPKEFHTLAAIGAAFRNNVDAVMGYGGFFGFFAKILLFSMNFLHDLTHLSYALVIILITILIKLVFWPLTQASTRSMKRMSALQPQMKAIQEKFKDDPAKMNRKMMEFMKEHKVSPMAGCLPMLVQLPIFFGFYQMIQSAIELRGAAFLWASDLSQPDTIFTLPYLNFPVNPLPLLMGVTMLWQARLTPPSPGMDPMQQKIMKYMPLMFLFMLYNFSAGLTLYWTVQNVLTIAQMKLTRSKDEAAATAQKPVSVGPPKKKH